MEGSVEPGPDGYRVMLPGCMVDEMPGDGAGRPCGKDPSEGASNDCDKPSVVGGAVTPVARAAMPGEEKDARAEYPALMPGAHCDGAGPAPYGVVPECQYAGGRSDETPVDGAKACDTVAVSPD